MLGADTYCGDNEHMLCWWQVLAFNGVVALNRLPTSFDDLNKLIIDSWHSLIACLLDLTTRCLIVGSEYVKEQPYLTPSCVKDKVVHVAQPVANCMVYDEVSASSASMQRSGSTRWKMPGDTLLVYLSAATIADDKCSNEYRKTYLMPISEVFK
jgi:hypothetical protein